MTSWLATLRIILAVILTPIMLVTFILVIAISSKYVSFTLADLTQLVKSGLPEKWLMPVFAYVGTVALMIPYCQWLRRRRKLRLGFFLLGAYLLGGLVSMLSLLVVMPSSTISNLQPFTLLSIFVSSLLSSGTYSFFLAALFWYLGGMPAYAQAVQHEPQH